MTTYLAKRPGSDKWEEAELYPEAECYKLGLGTLHFKEGLTSFAAYLMYQCEIRIPIRIIH